MQTSKLELIGGMNARLECKILSNPLINHYWTKDGYVIENSAMNDYDDGDNVNIKRSFRHELKHELIVRNHDYLTVSTLLIRVSFLVQWN